MSGEDSHIIEIPYGPPREVAVIKLPPGRWQITQSMSDESGLIFIGKPFRTDSSPSTGSGGPDGERDSDV